MEIWLDAQLSPVLAHFIFKTFNIQCIAVRDMGLREAEDKTIFNVARERKNIVVITKDSDFTDLIIRHGSPPKIILLTCGNTSNDYLKKLFLEKLLKALELLETAENNLVEIES